VVYPQIQDTTPEWSGTLSPYNLMFSSSSTTHKRKSKDVTYRCSSRLMDKGIYDTFHIVMDDCGYRWNVQSSSRDIAPNHYDTGFRVLQRFDSSLETSSLCCIKKKEVRQRNQTTVLEIQSYSQGSEIVHVSNPHWIFSLLVLLTTHEKSVISLRALVLSSTPFEDPNRNNMGRTCCIWACRIRTDIPKVCRVVPTRRTAAMELQNIRHGPDVP
jgi:hypothetical protein